MIAAADAGLGLDYFARACELRFRPACLNLLAEDSEYQARRRRWTCGFSCGRAGGNLMEMSEADLQARACAHGWTFACDEAR